MQVLKQVQVRRALAEVVERDAEAPLAQPLQGRREGAGIDDGLLLGELEHDVVLSQPHGADFVAEARHIPPADAVILQRVICCYPHATALVEAAAEHARRVLVLTFPIDRWWARRGTLRFTLFEYQRLFGYWTGLAD